MKKSLNDFLMAFLAGGICLAAQAATAEIAIITNPKGACKSLTVDDAQKLFLAKSRSCSDQIMQLVEPESGSGARREFLNKVIHKDASEYKAYWSVLIFTGRARPSREVNSDADVKKWVAENEAAIGYIDAASVDSSVRVVLAVH